MPWQVGDRSQHTVIAFMGDLKVRLAKVQLTTATRLIAVAAVDQPPKCIGAIKNPIEAANLPIELEYEATMQH